MKKVKLALLVGALVFSASVMAQQDRSLIDSQGEFVVDSQGECVQTMGGIEGCGLVTQTMTLDANTFFDFDKDVLKPEGKATLDAAIEELKKAQTKGISIVGHTDSVGTEQYNQGLSERRAQSVANYLVSQGVDVNYLTVEGRGELQPAVPNDTSANRAKNRRVEVEFQASKTTAN